MSSAREAILGRVRKALATPMPAPHWSAPTGKPEPLFALPAPGELWSRFKEEFAVVMGEVLEPADRASAQALLANWMKEKGLKTLVAADHPLVRALVPADADVVWAGADSKTNKDWGEIDLGVTPCECLVAVSGSILVSAGLSGRAPSVLPPTHLVIATKDQLVTDLSVALDKLRSKYGANLPSTFSVVTGPSRTADIEKILVLGAHGPKRLTLLMLPADNGPS